MENNKNNSHHGNSKHKKKYNTLIGALLQGIFILCLISLLSWFLLVIWFGVEVMWHNGNDVSHQINAIIQSNLKLISNHSFSFIERALFLIEKLKLFLQYYLTYCFVLIKELLLRVNYQSSLMRPESSEIIINVTVGTIEVILSRVIIFLMNSPFMLSLLFVLIIDGLGQRDIRKFQGARESTFFFHRIKPLISKTFFILFLIYLVIPADISPIVILIPMAILMSVFAMVSIKSYKKYV